jgi:hypothetical protein
MQTPSPAPLLIASQNSDGYYEGTGGIRVKLVSYNIQNGFGIDGRYDLQRIACVVADADHHRSAGGRALLETHERG